MPFSGTGTGIQNANDVFFSSLANGNILHYNSTTAKWNNVSADSINVKDYGAKGDGIADDTAAVQAAITAAGAEAHGQSIGHTVFFPAGQYNLSSPLKLASKIRLAGAGMYSSRLYNNTTDLFTVLAGEHYEKIVLQELGCITGPSGGHVFYLYNSNPLAMGTQYSSYFAWSSVSNCLLQTMNTTSSLLHQREYCQLIGVTFDRCIFSQASGSTVPAFDVVVNGGLCNGNAWRNSQCHGNTTSAAPFFLIESTVNWVYGLVFDGLIGEQNNGGFMELRAVSVAQVSNCITDDGTVYQQDIFIFGTSRQNSSLYCQNVRIENSSRVAGSLAAGVVDIRTTGAVNAIVENCDLRNGTPATFATSRTTTIVGRSRPYTTATGGYTVTEFDQVIVCKPSAPMTVSLPDPSTLPAGRTYVIKNTATSTVTVSATNATIDGAASRSLAQWDSIELITDGNLNINGQNWSVV